MQNDAAGGWRYDWNSGSYYNAFGGVSVGASDFNEYIMPSYADLMYYDDGENRYVDESFLDIGVQSSSFQAAVGSALQAVMYQNGLMADGGDDPWASTLAFALVASALDGPLPFGEAIGLAAIGATAISQLLKSKLYNGGVLNPDLEGITTSRGTPFDWDFDPRIRGLQNDKYYPPGGPPPKWFWPAVAGASAYELIKNWQEPDFPPPPEASRDNTYIRQTPVYPYH